jgi:PAS domain S-box-containing protein
MNRREHQQTFADRPRPHRSETDERRAAWERSREGGGEHAPSNGSSVATGELAAVFGVFAALAENVRDYAIFLLDADGVIRYWGEGARLMKWWTKKQAQGGHLRLLYPEGGSEDGTAEEHLREAVKTGEYVGEGRRVRSDGSTFWAGITLTALRDTRGALVGFAKVTRDLTVRLAYEAALAGAGSARSARDAALEELKHAHASRDTAREDADFAMEQARASREYIQRVLEPQLAAMRVEHADLMAQVTSLNAEVQVRARSAERKREASGGS